MCLEDVTIDRQLRTKVYVSNIDSGRIPGNPNRLSIRVTCDLDTVGFISAQIPVVGSADVVTVPIAACSMGSGGGIVTSATGFKTATLKDAGDIIKGPMIVTASGGSNAYAIETYLEVMTPYSAELTKLPR